MNNLQEERNSVLRELSDDQNAIEQVFQYCNNPFNPDLLNTGHVFPLPEELHVKDWRAYCSGSGGDQLSFLQTKIVQLNIPVREGISQSESYRDVVRKGKPFSEENFDGRLTFEFLKKIQCYIHEHPAGSLPVITTSVRSDFEKLYRALACRCEPVSIQESVNATVVAGLINWDRVRNYRERWEKKASPLSMATGGWRAEMNRVAKEEPGHFHDRLILICKNSYSSVTAEQLQLDMDEFEWIEKSTVLRIEHEFTHYATKRLFDSMRNNILDETIADFMGVTAALGSYKAQWFKTFLGLENWPDVRQNGRIFTYKGDLKENAFQLLCVLTCHAAAGLEKLGAQFYKPEKRNQFFLALTAMTLELLASKKAEKIFNTYYAAVSRSG